ncbi:unnamed protein product [Ectocarpus sp. CCAP 1310/34]|nr:unnamed protein product [Ectocarpus sp. CCAP 1310/34]
MPNSTGPGLVSYPAVALAALLLGCSEVLMTAAPKANGIVGAGVGTSAASVAVGRSVLESAKAATDSLVEIDEALRGKPRDGGWDF